MSCCMCVFLFWKCVCSPLLSSTCTCVCLCVCSYQAGHSRGPPSSCRSQRATTSPERLWWTGPRSHQTAAPLEYRSGCSPRKSRSRCWRRCYWCLESYYGVLSDCHFREKSGWNISPPVQRTYSCQLWHSYVQFAPLHRKIWQRSLAGSTGDSCVWQSDPAVSSQRRFKGNCFTSITACPRVCLKARAVCDVPQIQKWWAISFTPVFVWYVWHLSVAGARIQDGVEDEHPETTVGRCKKHCRGGWTPLCTIPSLKNNRKTTAESLKSLTALLISIVSKHGTTRVIKITTESVFSFDFSPSNFPRRLAAASGGKHKIYDELETDSTSLTNVRLWKL